MPTVEGAGVPLAYEERGEGPTVLLVHGLASDAEAQRPLAEALAPGARVIAYDRRGYGASGAPVPYEGTTAEEQAEDAVALLRALGAAPAPRTARSTPTTRAWPRGRSRGASCARWPSPPSSSPARPRRRTSSRLPRRSGACCPTRRAVSTGMWLGRCGRWSGELAALRSDAVVSAGRRGAPRPEPPRRQPPRSWK
jgi:hypothetical protein